MQELEKEKDEFETLIFELQNENTLFKKQINEQNGLQKRF